MAEEIGAEVPAHDLFGRSAELGLLREAAVEALSAIRDGAAIEALVLALKSSDPSVRRAAAEALGQH